MSQSQLPFIRMHSARKTALVFVVSGLLALAACATPAPSDANESVGEVDQAARRGAPARLSFGATPAQVREGHTSSFALSSTPDLILHATLASEAYDGKTLLLRGVGPQGELTWSYPHLQKGSSFDAVIPVFGSRAARKQTTGSFRFQVTAPDGKVLAEGNAMFTSAAASVRTTTFQPAGDER